MNDTWHRWPWETCDSTGGQAAGPPGEGLWSGVEKEEQERGGSWLSLRAEPSWPEVPVLRLALPGPAELPESTTVRVVATGQVKHVDVDVAVAVTQ